VKRTKAKSIASRRVGMRLRRHLRIRRKVTGTSERPRLAVHRSLKHVVGQIIDDSRGVTLVGVSSSEPEVVVPERPAPAPRAPAEATPEEGGEAAPTKAEKAAKADAKAGGKGEAKAGKGGGKADGKGAKGTAAKPDKKKAGGAADRPEGNKAARARAAGRVLAERARAKGIQRVVFDRGGYVFHGRVRAFAEGAREGGLEF
jgi:ribosomal protein L18